MYIIHHLLLLLAPFYCTYRSNRFELFQVTFPLVLEVFFVAIFVNFVIQTFVAYISGLNINYHLYPPPLPNDFLQNDECYRFKVALVLLLLSY
eukprot:Pgem_evm1s15260